MRISVNVSKIGRKIAGRIIATTTKAGNKHRIPIFQMSRLSIDMKNPIFYKYEIRRGECQLIVLDRHRRYATMWPPHFVFEEYLIFSGMAAGGGESTWPYCRDQKANYSLIGAVDRPN